MQEVVKNIKEKNQLAYDVNYGSSVCVTSRWRSKIDTVRGVVSLGEGCYVVVVTSINQRIPKDKVSRNTLSQGASKQCKTSCHDYLEGQAEKDILSSHYKELKDELIYLVYSLRPMDFSIKTQ